MSCNIMSPERLKPRRLDPECTCLFHLQDPEIPIMFSMTRGAVLVLLFYTGLLPFIPIKESFLEIMLPLTMIR